MSNPGLPHVNQAGARPGLLHTLVPVKAWMRTPALVSWPAILFVALVTVPPIGLVILGPNPTMGSFSDASWLFAFYFAVAWLLLIGAIVRPALVTRELLFVVVVLALLIEIPLAVALESALHATNANLLSSIVTIGLPEELAKAIPVLLIAAFFRRRLSPVDYLFLGAVSGLVFGASEVERYISAVVQNTSSGNITDGDAGVLILAYVWRFITDPISHACWAGLTGYFIGLAVSGTHKWYRVFWVGLAMAIFLHGLNDWNAINGNAAWIVVVAVSGILFLAYAKAPAHPAMPVHHSTSLAGLGTPPPGLGTPPPTPAPGASYAPRHGAPPTQPPPPPPAPQSHPHEPQSQPHPQPHPQPQPQPQADPQPQPQPQPLPQTPVPATHGTAGHPSPLPAHHPPTVTVPPSPRKKPWWEE
jgi:RsiW-degrading membrane proteinase PrsW (M82 family)